MGQEGFGLVKKVIGGQWVRMRIENGVLDFGRSVCML